LARFTAAHTGFNSPLIGAKRAGVKWAENSRFSAKQRRYLSSSYFWIEENIRDPKKMWRTRNKVLDKNVETVSLSNLEVEGKYLTRERGVVEAMNRHFALVGPTLG